MGRLAEPSRPKNGPRSPTPPGNENEEMTTKKTECDAGFEKAARETNEYSGPFVSSAL